DYVTLHDADVQRGALRSRLDAIVLPDQNANDIRHGHPPGSLPDEYTGGLGKDGAARLAEFVKAGGTLVALDTASLFAIDELSLRVKTARAGRRARRRSDDKDEPTPFYCPGAILRAEIAADLPLAHGLEPETPIWFESSPAFETSDANVVLRYPDANPLLSGW